MIELLDWLGAAPPAARVISVVAAALIVIMYLLHRAERKTR